MSLSFSESDPRTTTPVSNVSRTGVLVVTTSLIPIGSRVQVRFVAVPDQEAPFLHTGRVVRHETNPRGMGVELDPMEEDRREQLEQILESAERRTRTKTRRRGRVVLDGDEVITKLVDE